MRLASPTVLTALFKMKQINIFYCPDLVFEFYLMCPCISVIDFNKDNYNNNNNNNANNNNNNNNNNNDNNNNNNNNNNINKNINNKFYLFINEDILLKLYVSYLRLYLEYGLIIWAPHSDSEIKLLDAFHHCVLTLHRHNIVLEFLETRRKRIDLA